MYNMTSTWHPILYNRIIEFKANVNNLQLKILTWIMVIWLIEKVEFQTIKCNSSKIFKSIKIQPSANGVELGLLVIIIVNKQIKPLLVEFAIQLLNFMKNLKNIMIYTIKVSLTWNKKNVFKFITKIQIIILYNLILLVKRTIRVAMRILKIVMVLINYKQINCLRLKCLN